MRLAVGRTNGFRGNVSEVVHICAAVGKRAHLGSEILRPIGVHRIPGGGRPTCGYQDTVLLVAVPERGIDTAHAVLGTSESCIATYPGDLAAALVAFDAVVDVASVRGERTIAVAELHREPGDTPEWENTLEADELVIRIRVPVTRVGRASTYLKIRPRESYAFALAAAAVALELREDGKVADCRIALGGVATRPWRAGDAERSLIGKALTPDASRRAGEIAFAGARPGRLNGFKIELGTRTVVDALRIAGERVSR